MILGLVMMFFIFSMDNTGMMSLVQVVTMMTVLIMVMMMITWLLYTLCCRSYSHVTYAQFRNIESDEQLHRAVKKTMLM